MESATEQPLTTAEQQKDHLLKVIADARGTISKGGDPTYPREKRPLSWHLDRLEEALLNDDAETVKSYSDDTINFPYTSSVRMYLEIIGWEDKGASRTPSEEPMDTEWQAIPGAEIRMHFGNEPVGSVRKRTHSTLGTMLGVFKPGGKEPDLFILKKGEKGFPVGKAVPWQEKDC